MSHPAAPDLRHLVSDTPRIMVVDGSKLVRRLIGDGLGISADDVRHLEPLPKQQLTDEERDRMANLGKNGPRNVEGLTMTHCVPNERVVVER